MTTGPAVAPPPRRSIPWVWVGVVLVMVVALVREVWVGRARESPLVGQAAPALSLPLAEPGGDRMRLEDLRGRVVLLEFWATWCGACRASTPRLNALSERYGDRGLRVVGINVDSPDTDQAAAGHRAFGGRYPTLWDERREAQAAFRVEGLPTLVLIDAQGVVRRVAAGVPSQRRWAGFITDLL